MQVSRLVFCVADSVAAGCVAIVNEDAWLSNVVSSEPLLMTGAAILWLVLLVSGTSHTGSRWSRSEDTLPGQVYQGSFCLDFKGHIYNLWG